MNLFYKFNQFRKNVPDICQTPFFTNQIRYEFDTRDVNDWNEYDYFELHGLSAVDSSMVNWYGKAKWDVIYVPHADASGVDSFTYSGTDCPGTTRVGFSQRWSPNVGTINVNIVPVGTAGIVTYVAHHSYYCTIYTDTTNATRTLVIDCRLYVCGSVEGGCQD